MSEAAKPQWVVPADAVTVRTQAELDALPPDVPVYLIHGDFRVHGPRRVWSGQGAFVQHVESSQRKARTL